MDEVRVSPIEVEGLDADGNPFRREATFVLSANTARYGGDPILSPHADPAGDLLELVLFTSRSRKTLMDFYHHLSGGKAAHLSDAGVSRMAVRAFTARSLAGYELEVQVDGDATGTTPVTVGPTAGHVEILVPDAERGREADAAALERTSQTRSRGPPAPPRERASRVRSGAAERLGEGDIGGVVRGQGRPAAPTCREATGVMRISRQREVDQVFDDLGGAATVGAIPVVRAAEERGEPRRSRRWGA